MIIRKLHRVTVAFVLAIVASAAIDVRAEAGKARPQEFIRKPGQSVKKFLQTHAPKGGEELVHFGRLPLTVGHTEVLVGAYEGGFDDKGQPSSGENANRQFAFGFVRDSGSAGPYLRFPITGFFDDGGSPVNILAVFTARFAVGSPNQLAFLSVWSTEGAGGESVMDVSGLLYTVNAFDFDPTRGFVKLNSSVVKELGGTDGVEYNEKRTRTKKLRANATTVAAVKARLQALGIPQSAD